MTEIQELRDIVQMQARRITMLTRLVERIGRDLDGYINADYGTFEAVNPASRYPYTVAGQRQYDADMHEAEGPPPDAGMLENVQ